MLRAHDQAGKGRTGRQAGRQAGVNGTECRMDFFLSLTDIIKIAFEKKKRNREVVVGQEGIEC